MKALLVKKTQFWYNLYHNNVGIGSTHKSLQGYKLSQENCDEIFGVMDKQIEVEIVMEEEFIFDPAMGISQGHYLNKPKLDSEGCLILKMAD
jgi:hypothetical protein